MLTLNINKDVRVVLTARGQLILNKSEFAKEWRSWIVGGETILTIEVQLWKLIVAFGPHMGVGAPAYFVNNDIVLIGRIIGHDPR